MLDWAKVGVDPDDDAPAWGISGDLLEMDERLFLSDATRNHEMYEKASSGFFERQEKTLIDDMGPKADPIQCTVVHDHIFRTRGNCLDEPIQT